jgi:hypothetical protein
MKRTVGIILACLLAIALAFGNDDYAGVSKDGRSSPNTQATTQATNARLERVEKALEAQQEQIEQLRQQLQIRNSRIRQLQEQVDQDQSIITEAGQNPGEEVAKGDAAASLVRSQASDLESNQAVTTLRQEAQKSVSAPESPPAIYFKGITLTPGGFLDATGIYRTHNENANGISTFAAIPFSGTANSHLSEFRGTGRETRLSLLAEGKIKDWKASGYAEFDFEGASVTANEIESNSFPPRARQLWAQVEFQNGLSVSGGQTWSLLTTNRSGIALRNEWVPATIDLQYVVGYNWARQFSLRVTKKLGNNVWAAIAAESPQTTFNVTNAPLDVFGFNTSSNAMSPGSAFVLSNTPGANGVSTDLAPDLIGKVAFEPGWGHFEVKALGRFFRDRTGGRNQYTEGGGGGVAAILPFLKDKLDVVLEGMAGVGIGRYASGLGPDVTLRPNATIVPLHELQTMAGVEAHPGSRLDLYLYGGDEYYGRAAYLNAAGLPVGYGSPRNNNSGCEIEVPRATQPCQAQTRNLWEVEPGFWYRFYKGPRGTVQWGMSYSYVYRQTWAGASGLQPKGIENMVMSSFRYILP